MISESDSTAVVGSPVVESVIPPSGPLGGGNQVLVVGGNFPQDARVRFGDVSADPAGVIVESPERLRATVPPGVAPGRVAVRVTGFAGRFGFLPDGYEYQGTGP